jgi:hypothetical protein
MFPVAAKCQCHIVPALLFIIDTVLTRIRPEYALNIRRRMLSNHQSLYTITIQYNYG